MFGDRDEEMRQKLEDGLGCNSKCREDLARRMMDENRPADRWHYKTKREDLVMMTSTRRQKLGDLTRYEMRRRTYRGNKQISESQGNCLKDGAQENQAPPSFAEKV